MYNITHLVFVALSDAAVKQGWSDYTIWHRDIKVRQFVITKNKVTKEKKNADIPNMSMFTHKNGGV